MVRKLTIPKFDSATGAGTLSGISRETGVSIDDLVKANRNNSSALPDPNNRDLIREGAELIIPDTTPQVQQTTSERRVQTQERSNKLDEILAGAVDEDLKSQEDQNFDNDSQSDRDAELQDQEDEITRDAQARIKEVEDTLGRLQKQADAATRSLISSIKQIYGARIEKMKKVNKANLETKRVLGFRQGRSRFASDLHVDILSDEEQAGHERIATLEGSMLQAIAQAESARAEGRVASFNNMFAKVEKITNDMKAEIADLHKKAVEQDKAIRDAEKAERDAQRDALNDALKRSERAAPGLLTSLDKFDNEDDRIEFLAEFSNLTNIPIDILMGDVEGALTDREKAELANRNTENLIRNRDNTNARANASNARAQADFDEKQTQTEVRSGIFDLLNKSQSEKQEAATELGVTVTDVENILLEQAKEAWLASGLKLSDFEKEFSSFIGEEL